MQTQRGMGGGGRAGAGGMGGGRGGIACRRREMRRGEGCVEGGGGVGACRGTILQMGVLLPGNRAPFANLYHLTSNALETSPYFGSAIKPKMTHFGRKMCTACKVNAKLPHGTHFTHIVGLGRMCVCVCVCAGWG